ncbi:hypothetical protein [Streptomyces sp. MBT53]|uniref:hypothetical protein n=1 Tax=Streptomyces sp. MBT53 TaxID=1488384 RepID=UPI0019146F93|nr:hypothetical protein [Streptomyces sp. MBT53]MBK6015609.1 hypothetical protein [Streptomyces sp. MBT53]
MKHQTTALALATVAALAALTGCSSSDDTSAKSTSSAATESVSASDAAAALHNAGIPAKPTGQARTALLAALRKVSPALVADEDKAVDNSRNQCSAINGESAKVDWSAQQRFGTSSHEVSEAEAKQINTALTAFCKTA